MIFVFAEVVAAVVGELDRAIAWVGWGMSAGEAALQDAPGPPPPGFDQAYLDALLGRIDQAIARLAVPALRLPVPAGALPADASFDAIRATIRERIATLTRAQDEWLQARSDAGELDHLIEEIEAVIRMMDMLANFLENAIGQVPHETWVTCVFVNWDYVHEHAIPELSRQTDRAQSVKRDYQRALENRRRVLADAATVVAADLVAEGAALALEAQVLQRSRDELERSRAILNRLEGTIAECQARRQATSMDLQEVRDRLRDISTADREAQETMRSSDQKLARLRSQRARPYDRCPNHEPYGTCTHLNLKREWDAAVRDLDTEIRDELRWQEGARQETLERANEREMLSQEEARLVRGHSQLTGQLARLRLELQGSQTAYHEQVNADLLLRERSRADIFDSENRADANMVARIREELR